MAGDQGREEDESEVAGGSCHVALFFYGGGGGGGFLACGRKRMDRLGESEKFVRMPRNLEISDLFFFSLLYRKHRSRCGEGHVTAVI